MAVSIIEQSPLLNILNILTPVGQDLIFVVSNQTAVLNETRVKFVAEVYIGTSLAAVNPIGNTPIGTFKTTPNNAGVGMFDLRNVVENYVKADNMAANGSKYKTTLTSATARHPIHLIDKYSLNTNLGRYMLVRFSVEYLVGTTVQIDTNTRANSSPLFIFNGYVKHTDVLNKSGNNFGYNATKLILIDSTSEFLTNAPTTQYANLEDYGTLSMMTQSADLYQYIDLIIMIQDNTYLAQNTIAKELSIRSLEFLGCTFTKTNTSLWLFSRKLTKLGFKF
jgi:hypothetical protein